MKWRVTGKISNQTNIKKKIKKLFPVVWIALLLVSVYRFLFKEMLRSVKRVHGKSYLKRWVCHFAIIISSRRLTSKPNLSRLLMHRISSNKCLHSNRHPPTNEQPSPWPQPKHPSQINQPPPPSLSFIERIMENLLLLPLFKTSKPSSTAESLPVNSFLISSSLD